MATYPAAPLSLPPANTTPSTISFIHTDIGLFTLQSMPQAFKHDNRPAHIYVRPSNVDRLPRFTETLTSEERLLDLSI